MPDAHRELNQTHGADSGPLEPVPQPCASALSGQTSRTPTELKQQGPAQAQLSEQTRGEVAGEQS